VTVSYRNAGNTDLPAPLLVLQGDNARFQTPGHTDYSRPSLQLYAHDPDGPFGILPPGASGSITVSYVPITAGAGVRSTFTLQTLKDPAQPFDWNALAQQDVPIGTSPQQWADIVAAARQQMGDTWGDVVSFVGQNSLRVVRSATGIAPVDANALVNASGF